MFSRLALVALLFFATTQSPTPWTMQDSHSTAGLRGVHAVSDKVAWASGTAGTILRTIDGGANWQRCPTPPGAEKLDFRGIWAWDAADAIVMSSGTGDLSRLFETIDGGERWIEVARNPDKEGFWDGIVFSSEHSGIQKNRQTGVLFGDPVNGSLYTAMLSGRGDWTKDDSPCKAAVNESAFAASNSSVFVFGSRRYVIGTGGIRGPHILLSPLLASRDVSAGCLEVPVPLAGGCDSCGVFSVVFHDVNHGVAVSGDYRKPGETSGTAAWTVDGGRHWTAASKMPHGFRSAVAWDAKAKIWIAAGTNGSDISRDNGKTWEPLDDGNWNALSLPYAVGPNGRIGKFAD